VFYVFHGEDEFSRARTLAGFRAELAKDDPAMADLNTTNLDGSRLTMGELRHACDTIPFMAERRMVIVLGLLGRLAPGARGKGERASQGEEPAWRRAFLDELVAYLPVLPPTTRLIFVEEKALSPSHPVLKLIKAEGKKGGGFAKLFQPPKEGELPNWIRRHARANGGEIDREAAKLLAMLIGSDLRLLDQETEKLLLYAEGRPVNAQDVLALVSRAREVNIFDLVDCVGRRETDRALQLLHHMLDDQEAPLYLLTMLARQIRILIQVSELRSQGLKQQEIVSQLGLHPFVVKKTLAQASNFSMDQLLEAHRRLVETDWSIKTGNIDDELALDMLVVNLTRAQGPKGQPARSVG
jgi:DNA polymerase-3 subunit delta